MRVGRKQIHEYPGNESEEIMRVGALISPLLEMPPGESQWRRVSLQHLGAQEHCLKYLCAQVLCTESLCSSVYQLCRCIRYYNSDLVCG